MTVRFGWLMLCALALPAAAPAPTAERILVRNNSASDIECRLLAAHWYTPLPAASAPPGGQAELRFSFDASRGEAVDDPVRQLPLEVLYCGRAGRAWETRSTLDLPVLAARAALDGTAKVTCGDVGDALLCSAAP
jgi:hypothetical protein